MLFRHLLSNWSQVYPKYYAQKREVIINDINIFWIVSADKKVHYICKDSMITRVSTRVEDGLEKAIISGRTVRLASRPF